MKDDLGIPALIRQATSDASAPLPDREVALQMLAQDACQNSAAATTLLEQAKAGKLTGTAWDKVAGGVAGSQYYVGRPPAEIESDPLRQHQLQTFHVASGNQNYYALPLEQTATGDELGRRSEFLSNLLAVTTDPVGLQSLQAAQARLAQTQPLFQAAVNDLTSPGQLPH